MFVVSPIGVNAQRMLQGRLRSKTMTIGDAVDVRRPKG